jgi:enolase
MIPGAGRAEGSTAMKNFIAALAFILIAGTTGAGQATVPSGKPLKLALAKQSSVAMVDVMKNITEKCPNVTMTTNLHSSDYMLYAGGYSGAYRFMIIAKGGDTIYATQTQLLSNAVKDVCHFLNTRA